MLMITVGRKPDEVEGCLSSDYGYDDDDSFDNGYYEVILKKCHSSNSRHYYSIALLAIVTFIASITRLTSFTRFMNLFH